MDIQVFINNFAEQFDETDVTLFAPETHFRDLDEWSSFMALSIMAMVKSEYDVALTADEMRFANTIQDLFNIVSSRNLKA